MLLVPIPHGRPTYKLHILYSVNKADLNTGRTTLLLVYEDTPECGLSDF